MPIIRIEDLDELDLDSIVERARQQDIQRSIEEDDAHYQRTGANIATIFDNSVLVDDDILSVNSTEKISSQKARQAMIDRAVEEQKKKDEIEIKKMDEIYSDPIKSLAL